MTLLDDIKSDLTNENAALSNTLRKAMILASKLQLPEMTDWLKYELEGYLDKNMVPKYRISQAINLGTFHGPFNSQIKNVTLPKFNLPDSIKEWASNIIMAKGIGELESMLKTGSDSFQIRWPQEAILLARDRIEMTNGMVLFDAYQPISSSFIAGIIDNIKNKLLRFILDLESSDIALDNRSDIQPEKEQIRNMFNIIIYGDKNIVTSGEKVLPPTYQGEPANINSLIKYIASLDIDQEYIKALESAIKKDKIPPSGQFGTQVKKWLGDLVAKASSGVYKLSIEIIIILVTEALKKYYGF
ncbi:MAG: hypothetical protein RBT05_00595 [Bacteroidales bacterium]|jgi:hypothetical protein|nr:hypothetical protein [Actinomycetota bacterium]MDX9797337.1 hypothetical protein [Bacteroidales bacterium]